MASICPYSPFGVQSYTRFLIYCNLSPFFFIFLMINDENHRNSNEITPKALLFTKEGYGIEALAPINTHMHSIEILWFLSLHHHYFVPFFCTILIKKLSILDNSHGLY